MFPVHPTIWGDGLQKADMLVITGVVISGTTDQWTSPRFVGAGKGLLGFGEWAGAGAGALRGTARGAAVSLVRVYAGA